jgi:DNA (cytosine-5)-methyltransferase 1
MQLTSMTDKLDQDVPLNEDWLSFTVAPQWRHNEDVSEPSRFSLRLEPGLLAGIDARVERIPGALSRNTWIAQAIQEKIQREPLLNQRVPAGPKRFYEFFAGGGMARAGLGRGWACTFANEIDETKAASYIENWGADGLLTGDVNHLSAQDLPDEADLAWASFPCQDLSLAGNAEGIGHWADAEQTRSGTFWPFWRLMRQLGRERRAPRVIVLENVYGALTSNEGRDFRTISASLADEGYNFGALVIDARMFLPQSRPRLFIVAVRHDVLIPEHLKDPKPNGTWHPQTMQDAVEALPEMAKKAWVWWNLAEPTPHNCRFTDIIEDVPTGVEWHTQKETLRLLQMMSPTNRAKVESAKETGRLIVGGLYKRTRVEDGIKMQRAEVRFDEIAGCLRTPAGGSSRQTILVVHGKSVRSRLLSPREAARLMGLPDSYRLPRKYNDAYHLAGDGVAVPVVRHLAASILEPILSVNTMATVAQERP